MALCCETWKQFLICTVTVLPIGEFLSPVAILKEIVILVKEKASLKVKGSKTTDKTEAKIFVKTGSFMKW